VSADVSAGRRTDVNADVWNDVEEEQ